MEKAVRRELDGRRVAHVQQASLLIFPEWETEIARDSPQLVRRFLEREIEADITVRGPLCQEVQPEQRFSGARSAFNQRGARRGQAASKHFVEARHAERDTNTDRRQFS